MKPTQINVSIDPRIKGEFEKKIKKINKEFDGHGRSMNRVITDLIEEFNAKDKKYFWIPKMETGADTG